MRKNIILYTLNLALLFIGYYMFFWYSLTADEVYGYAINGTVVHFAWNDMLDSIAGGRWMAGILHYAFSWFKYDQLRDQWIMQLIKEMVCAYIPVRLVGIFRKDDWSFSKCIAVNLLFLMCTLNVYIEELFAFNTAWIAIGWVLAVEAVVLFTREKYIRSGILMFLSLGVYQANFTIVVIIALAWLLYQNGSVYSIAVLKKCIYLAIIIFIPSIITIVIPSVTFKIGMTDQIVKETIISGDVDWKNNMIRLAGFIFAFLFTSAQGMMPYGLVVIYLVFLYIIYYLMMKRNEVSNVTKFLSITYITLFFVSCYVIGFIQSVVSVSPRVAFGVFFAVSMLAFLVYEYTKETRFEKSVLIATIVFELTLFGCVFTSGIDHRISNQLDIDYAKQVQNKIDDYEKHSEYEVEDIHFYYCKPVGTKVAYDDYLVHHYFVQSYNNSIFSTSWGTPSMMSWYFGRDYNAKDMSDEEYEACFGNISWDSIDLDKQIKFEGNQMYWAIYLR